MQSHDKNYSIWNKMAKYFIVKVSMIILKGVCINNTDFIKLLWK